MTTVVTDRTEVERAVGESIAKVVALTSDRTVRDGLSDREADAKLRALLDEVVVQLKEHPEAIGVLEKRLRERSPDEEIVRTLAGSSLPGAQSEMQRALTRLEGKESGRCEAALIIGRLGKYAPDVAVNTLLRSAVAVEHSDAVCLARAVMLGGRGALDVLAKAVEENPAPESVFVGAQAVVIVSQATTFRAEIGLASDEALNRVFSGGRRGMRSLVRKWGKWWLNEGGKYVVDDTSDLLVDDGKR